MLLLAPNAIETFEVLVEGARAGLVAVPVNWRLAPGELAAVAADAGARLVVVDPSLAHLDTTLPDAANPAAADRREPDWRCS